MSAPAYRSDIDGLRALAVLPVVLFHARLAGVSGGFVGVDIFFVISGFLITGIIWSEIQGGTFTIRSFYERRIRRIFPAFFTMIAIVTIAALVILSPSELASYGKRLFATLGFLSNFKFVREADYFASDSEVNPLLHMWSLSVEEQFYIVFPILLVILFKLKAPPKAVIAALFAGSLAISCWGVGARPVETFYLLPTRAWELLLGSLLALGAVPVARARWTNEVLAGAGLGMIAYAIVAFSRHTPFPGYNALLPCVGSALIIHAGSTPTLVGRALSQRVVVRIGLISYALYLFHWPLLVFASYLYPAGTSQTVAVVVAVVVSFALAAASLPLIETPFRKRRVLASRRAVFAVAACAMLIGGLGAIGLVLTKGLPFRFGLDRAFYAEVDQARSEALAAYGRGTCFFDRTSSSSAASDHCIDAHDADAILMIGDSHLAHLIPGIRARWPDAQLSYLAAAGCRPLVGVITRNDAVCRTIHDRWFAQTITARRWKTILIAGEWIAADLPALEQTIGVLARNAERVVLVGPSLEYHGLFPELYAVYGDEVDHKLARERVELDAVLRARTPAWNVTYVSMVMALCPAGSCRHMADATTYMHWDSGHLTVAGSRWVVARWPMQLRE